MNVEMYCPLLVLLWQQYPEMIDECWALSVLVDERGANRVLNNFANKLPPSLCKKRLRKR